MSTLLGRAEWELFRVWTDFRGKLADARGQGTVEYGFLLAVIALGVAAALYLLRDRLAAFFTDVAGRLQSP